MIWLALYFTPVGLLAFFLVYAAGRRTGFKPLEYLGMLGLPSDVFAAYTWFRVFGPWPWTFPDRTGSEVWKARTVTAFMTHLARAELARDHKTVRGQLALLVCRFLNWVDPGHCRLD